jgi:hypothetical protein
LRRFPQLDADNIIYKTEASGACSSNLKRMSR